MDNIKRKLYSRLGQNILANYCAVIWMAGLNLALIPVYIRGLGATEWGIVAICMTIQGFFALLDSGLGQILPREIAKVASDGRRRATVFRTFARGYALIGIIGCLIGQIAVPWLVSRWFNPEGAELSNVSWALRLVLVQFLFQCSNNAHIGYWNGMQEQKIANIRQCCFATAKHCGAIILVFGWQRSAIAYLLPFLIIAGLEAYLNRRRILSQCPPTGANDHLSYSFKDLAKQSGILAVAVIVGTLTVQMDKIILSHGVPISSYGRYIVVATLGVAFLQFQYPLMRAFFPRIVGAYGPLQNHSRSMSQLFFASLLICVLPCFLMALVAPQVLKMWTGDAQIVLEGSTPLRVILLSVALNAVYNVIYQRMVAQGAEKVILGINIMALLVIISVVPNLVSVFGITAGSLVWLISSLVQLAIGVWWIASMIYKERKQCLAVPRLR